MDPARYAALSRSRDTPLLDRATRGRYAPGSTFKPIVGLAGLALGLADWERTIVDRGEFRLPNQRRVYRDWSWTPNGTGGQGVVDLHRAIYRSSNVYFYMLGCANGHRCAAEFRRAVRLWARDVAGRKRRRRWHFAGQRVEVGPKRRTVVSGDTVNMSIGQGDLLVTPLQLATVTAGDRQSRPACAAAPAEIQRRAIGRVRPRGGRARRRAECRGLGTAGGCHDRRRPPRQHGLSPERYGVGLHRPRHRLSHGGQIRHGAGGGDRARRGVRRVGARRIPPQARLVHRLRADRPS